MTALRQRLRAVRALSSRRLPAVLQIYKFLLVALFICVIFIFAWPRERSYIVEAQTSSLSVTMSGLSDRAWQLEKAVICQRRSRLDLTAQPEKDLPDWAKGQCTQQRYVARYLDNGATLEWPALIHLKIYRPGAGWQAPLEILIDGSWQNLSDHETL